jgi:hypothetical protein
VRELKPESRIRDLGVAVLAFVAVLVGTSCSKGPTPPDTPPKLDPQTELTFAPIQFDTTTFRVHFYWNGYDDDGEVMRFRYAVDDDSLKPINEWASTTAKDTTLLFLVDPVKELKVHTFKVSAEDNDGRFDLTPATRSFSAKTVPPFSEIEKGPAAFNPVVGPNFTYEWSGIDPDGGETGGKAPVDSFQYLLLRVRGIADTENPPQHDPLPAFEQNLYVKLVRDAVGDGLLRYSDTERYDDWKWQGIRALKNRFRNITDGEYVFAERAVDIAGATEKDLVFVRNIRHFTVTSRTAGPLLTVCSSILNRCLDNAIGPEDFARKQLQIFEGETVSFSWSADASTYGGEIVGYTYALDDTSSFPGLDARLTGATFQPSRLQPGTHFLYVRAVDDGGLVTNMKVPLLIVHPNFKEPGFAHAILFVDDSIVRLGNFSAPNDQTETEWWASASGPNNDGPLIGLGVPYTEWDTFEQSQGSIEGRKQPEARDLANFTTVVWTTDAENGGSVQTALFKTVAGADYSELQGYLRAGGTLILTGWNLAQNTSGTANLTFKTDGPAPNGICATFAPGTLEYNRTIFPRMYMGIDNSYQSLAGLRSQGAADFTRGVPTATGIAFGFDTARVDTGNFTTGVLYPDPDNTGLPQFKWNTNGDLPPGSNFDLLLFPGIARIEGWILARNFGCQAIQNFGFENPAAPIVQIVYTYEGIRQGPFLDGPPSPRQGLGVGALIQSHDLATNAGNYVASAAIGRIALFTFPLYFLEDAEAINIMKRAFAYVDQSPTLSATPP